MEPLFTKPGFVDEAGRPVAKPPHPSLRGPHSPYVLWQRRDVNSDTPVQHSMTLSALADGEDTAARYQQWLDMHRKVYPWANMNGEDMERALARILDRPIRLLRVISLRHPRQMGSTLSFHFDDVSKV